MSRSRSEASCTPNENAVNGTGVQEFPFVFRQESSFLFIFLGFFYL